MEEPPDQCLIFLITSFPEQLLDTILSRCIKVPLKSRKKHIADNDYGNYLRGLLSEMPTKEIDIKLVFVDREFVLPGKILDKENFYFTDIQRFSFL